MQQPVPRPMAKFGCDCPSCGGTFVELAEVEFKRSARLLPAACSWHLATVRVTFKRCWQLPMDIVVFDWTVSLLRVIPTFSNYSDIVSDISLGSLFSTYKFWHSIWHLPGILSDSLSGTDSSGTPHGVRASVCPGWAGILSGINYPGFLVAGTCFDVQIGILSNILSEISSGVF